MGIAVVVTEELPSDGLLEDVMFALPGARMGIGALDRQRVAIFAAAESVPVVRERLSKTRDDLARHVRVRACAELSFSDPVPRLAPGVLLAWVNDVLARAPDGSSVFLSMQPVQRGSTSQSAPTT